MKLQRTMAATAAILAVLVTAGCAATAASPSPSSPSASKGPLYDELPQAVKDLGYIRAAGDSHPPYRTVEADNTITGLDADLWKALSEQLGVPVKIELVSAAPSILTGIQAGRYDAYNGPKLINDAAKTNFDTISWQQSAAAWFALDSSDITLKKGEDVCGKSVAYLASSAFASYFAAFNTWCVNKGLGALTAVELLDTNALLLAVQSGRADILAASQGEVIALNKIDPGTIFLQGDEQGTPPVVLGMLIGKDTGLADVMLKAYQGIIANGEFARILKKYDFQDTALPEPLLN